MIRTKHCKQDEGFTLVELLVSMLIILGVLISVGWVTTQTLTLQQNGEARDKGVQIARDFIEKSKQAPFANLGFHASDTGYRTSSPTTSEETVTVPEDKNTFSVIPLDTNHVIGGTQYTIRTDITWTLNTHATSPKRVRVEVSWLKDDNTVDKTVISYIRASTASEQIPSDLDLTVIPGSTGVPSAPSYYDVINSTGGFKSIYGTGYMIKILNPGDYPVNDLKFTITCPSLDPVDIFWSSPPVGMTKTQTGTTYQFSYYGATPASLPCDITTATTVVSASNTKGYGAPLTITPTNFIVY